MKEVKVICICSLGPRFKARLHERKKWNGSDKKWPFPVLPVPFKKGSIGAYGPFSERNG